MRKICLIIIVAIFLGAFSWAVAQKENQLIHGTAVILRIAPLDPRSLMQGDYMELDFDVTRAIEQALYDKHGDGDDGERIRRRPRSGLAVFSLNENRVASFIRLAGDEAALAPGEIMMKYRLRADQVQLASGAFFFQEGHGAFYDRAVYAELCLDDNGNPLIVNLLNQDFEAIRPLPRDDYGGEGGND